MTVAVKVFKDTYIDSVVQLSGTRAMYGTEGVDWAAAAMATPANLGTLASEGFQSPDLSSAGVNDLFLAVRADSQQSADAALAAAEQAMFATRADQTSESVHAPPRTLGQALDRQPGSNVSVISVPGDYAPLEAHKALSAGLDVLLFSDNVSVEAEIALKDRARQVGRLLMGPGAGTAMIAGTGLGFSNVVKPGRVGVIAAAGTGAQEAMSLLDRWGVGVACVIGLGGRDLTAAIDGRMAKQAVELLRDDPDIDAILLVSKPPADDVARAVVATAGQKPFVASFVGTTAKFDLPPTARVAATLEAGVLQTLDLLGQPTPTLVGDLEQVVAQAIQQTDNGRDLVRGLFSGGTLCYESLVILSDILGPVYSNTPLDKHLVVPAPAGSHICLDLGEEEYTKGRPHPMIDPEARIALLREQGGEPDVAAILLDVVIGHGSHDNPAAQLAPACEEIRRNDGPQIIAYVLGTRQDPQDYELQRRILADVGCIVSETAARASLAAAAIATRDASLVRRAL